MDLPLPIAKLLEQLLADEEVDLELALESLSLTLAAVVAKCNAGLASRIRENSGLHQGVGWSLLRHALDYARSLVDI
jgi:hypothetical protein